MDLGFRGDVVEFYQRYRRGYPDAAVDAVVAEFGLGRSDVVVDLGCGTGQLTVPFARRVRAAVGVDPEPDMLAAARRAADVPNVSWVLGADTDLAALGPAVGPVGAVTIGQALHWMDHERLFRTVHPLVRPGGGVAVFTNGTPLWLQDTEWSRALRGFLEHYLGTRLALTCGTDEHTQQRYADALNAAHFTVRRHLVEYEDHLDVERIIGGALSALPVDKLPADRTAFARALSEVLEPHEPFVERVAVRILTGRR
ncbi:class I SAM-dependent methyltransferase [Saccharothrix variisporea]|uniref:Methyltransferase family protein n=1 Tax=Saccharothrix variisporea TaxID=543527 RepID=A0A495X038_9PSEU|nr:class I SAM-dependent methyltransferase [Saccharothrix variisporea]RKT67260.1 methyltransferase family protein [Saccharothrix variisporea]